MAITQDISNFPPAPNSQTDTPTEFNAKADAFVYHQSSNYVDEVNTWADQANTLQADINNIVATLPEGTIDDTTPSLISTYSSSKIEADSYGIESGSNANGSYTKFPDGTLINVMPSINVTSASTYFNFPFPFIDSDYSFSATAIASSVVAENVTVSIRDKWENDSIGIYCVRDGVLANNPFCATVIGRWK